MSDTKTESQEREMVLLMEDMRFPKHTNMEQVARGTIAELQALVARESVEPYADGGRLKSFRQGGPLEWYGPAWAIVNLVLPPPVSELAVELARPHSTRPDNSEGHEQ